MISKLPNDKFTLVFARNVIHFFTYDQLIKFVENINEKMVVGGVLVLRFENNFLESLNKIVQKSFEEKKNNPNEPLDSIVKSVYNNYPFRKSNNQAKCSYTIYSRAQHNMRFPGFPCELSKSKFVDFDIQLLTPDNVHGLMEAAGYSLSRAYSKNDAAHTQVMVFKKVMNMSAKDIPVYIQSWVYSVRSHRQDRDMC